MDSTPGATAAQSTVCPFDPDDAATIADPYAVYRDLAAPLPVLVLAELFGVPTDMRPAFREWASVVTDDLRAATGEADEGALLGRGYQMFRYFWKQIRDRRANPRDDLLGVLA